MAQHLDINGKPYNRGLMIAVLLVGTFCTILNQTILTTAFPTLMKAFDVSTSDVQWLTTGFLMVNGIMIPVSAFLSSRFNTKWLYFAAMVIFEIGTVLAFIAPSFAVLLIARLIQAAGVGILMPLLQTIMLSIFPPENRGAAMGLAGIVIGVAPAIGPTLSGWVIDQWEWRYLFGIIIPIVAVVIVLSLFFMKPVIPTGKAKLDVLSLILSTIGFGTLLYGFSEVGEKGWGSMLVILNLLIGLVFLLLFSLRQLKLDEPFLDIKVFKNKDFTVSVVLGSLVMIALIGVEMVIPLYLQIIHGMSALKSGLSLLPGSIMMAIMSPITGKAFDKYGARRLGIVGLIILAIGTLPFVTLTKDTPTIYLVVVYAVRMFGISMVMMPVTTAGMNALPAKSISHGTAVNNTTRQVATSIGTAILVSVLANATKASMPAKSLVKEAPLTYKAQYLQATLDGYHATFWVALAFCIVGVIVAFFLKNKHAKGGEQA